MNDDLKYFINKNRINWLIPTYNEESTIKDVISSIKVGVPYVLDKSIDNTPCIAKKAGAIVVNRKGKGKGEAVKEGIALLKNQSDIIVLIDGDNTYSPEEVDTLIMALRRGADMAVGTRIMGTIQKGAMAQTNKLGNRFFNLVLNLCFNSSLTDFLSGYRAFYAKDVDPNELSSKGFDIEVELTALYLRKNLKIIEVPVTYSKREKLSDSKLNILTDGVKILYAIFRQYIRSIKSE